MTDMFESLTLIAPDDFAALDISYVEGEEVTEQGRRAERGNGPRRRGRRPQAQATAALRRRASISCTLSNWSKGRDDEPDEMLDPSALLVVMEALMKLTGGIGVDPQSGSLM